MSLPPLRFRDRLRGTWRALRLSLVVTRGLVSGLLGGPFRRARAARAAWLARLCARGLRVLEVNTQLTGARPHPGTLWAANHLSYLDILVLAAHGPVVFVAKREVRSWPIFGTFAALAGTVFIDRSRPRDVARVGAAVTAALAEGVSVVVFLEGTSSDGTAVLPFRPSLLAPVETAGSAPVVPVALHYVVPPPHSAAHEVCWWGEMTLTPHLCRLLTLLRINAHLHWGTPPPPPLADRKALADHLQREVTASLNSLKAQTNPVDRR